jgi:hypothetical protein
MGYHPSKIENRHNYIYLSQETQRIDILYQILTRD